MKIINKASEKTKVILFILCSFLLSRVVMYITCYFVTGVVAPNNTVYVFSIFDSEWYDYYVDLFYSGEFIGTRPNGMGAWAFFPLYPLVVHCFHRLLGGMLNAKLLGAVISSVFFMLSEYLAYKYIMLTRKSIKIVYTFIFFMSFGLYSFYFSILYTESLFLLLLILCFYYLEKENYLLMGAFGALLSATRNAGVFFVFVILVHEIMKFAARNKCRNLKCIVLFFKEALLQEKLVLGTVMVPFGLFANMLFLQLKLGDGLAFVHVQYAWDRESVGVLKNLYESVFVIFPPEYLGIILLSSIILILYNFFTKHNYHELVYPAIIIYLGASSALLSIPRFMVGAFVPVLCFSEHFSRLNRYAKILLGIVICMFEVTLIKQWIGQNVLLC